MNEMMQAAYDAGFVAGLLWGVGVTASMVVLMFVAHWVLGGEEER